MDGRRTLQVDELRDRERVHFDAQYAWSGDLEADTHETFLPCITPAFRPGGVPGGLVHRELWLRLTALGIAGRDVLDYASGAGHWGIRIALEGGRVRGFDLSPVGVERANRRASAAAVEAMFSCADASSLPYGDASFDRVIGVRALHHTIKYPGTADELYRVMRPRAWALFSENIDGWWGLRLARRWTMQGCEAGDVILTEPLIREWAARFSDVAVERFEFLTMAKKFGLPRRLLAFLHGIDTLLFEAIPATRRWGGECLVILRK